MVKARAFRQNILSSDCYNFKCNCELCQKEAISNDDDERYEKFEKLRKETKRLHNENNQHVANLEIWKMVDIQSIYPNTTFTNSMIKESIYQNLIDNTKKAIASKKCMSWLKIPRNHQDLCHITMKLSLRSSELALTWLCLDV